jgi:hypothetical protein
VIDSPDVDIQRRLGLMEKRGGQVYDQIACTYVPLTTALVETGGALVGAALNVGTYTAGWVGGGCTYSFNYPITAWALNIRITASWANAASASLAYCRPNGGTTNEGAPIARARLQGVFEDPCGVVSLDSAAKFQIVVANANTTAFSLYILGYFL